MVWVEPLPAEILFANEEEAEWLVIAENEFFLAQEQKSRSVSQRGSLREAVQHARSAPSTSTVKINPDAALAPVAVDFDGIDMTEQDYRVVTRLCFRQAEVVVAVSKNLHSIMQHWTLIERDIVPALRQFDMRVVEELHDAYQFLIFKFTSLFTMQSSAAVKAKNSPSSNVAAPSSDDTAQPPASDSDHDASLPCHDNSSHSDNDVDDDDLISEHGHSLSSSTSSFDQSPASSSSFDQSPAASSSLSSSSSSASLFLSTLNSSSSHQSGTSLTGHSRSSVSLQRSLADQDSAAQSRQSNQELFQTTFDLCEEQLVIAAECQLWAPQGRHRGTIYLSPNYVCYASTTDATKIIIHFNDIESIAKDTSSSSLGVNSLELRTVDGGRFVYSFSRSTDHELEEAYVLLQQLWLRSMNYLLALATKNRESATSSNSLQFATIPIAQGGLTTDVLDELRVQAWFAEQFRLPPSEKPVWTRRELGCIIERDGLVDEYICTLALSRHFLCFAGVEQRRSAARRSRSASVSSIARSSSSSSASSSSSSSGYSSGRAAAPPPLVVVLPFCEICNVRQLSSLPGKYGGSSFRDMDASCKVVTTHFSVTICSPGGSRTPARFYYTEIAAMFNLGQKMFFPYPKSVTALLQLRLRTTSDDSCASLPDLDSDDLSSIGADSSWDSESDVGELSADDSSYNASPSVDAASMLHGHILYLDAKLRQQVRRRGIASAQRIHAWPQLTGANYLRQAADAGYYDKLLKTSEGQTTEATLQIERDLHRTSKDEFFQNPETGIAVLRRILVAYSFRNPDIGYCQSMNIVCAALLLMMDEHQAFWTLCAICEYYLPGTYNPTMVGGRVNQRVFDLLLREYMPQVADKIQAMDIPIGMTCILPWFMCLFVGFLSQEDTYVLFDNFFVEGISVLFKCALAIFKANERAIVDADESYEVMQLLAPPLKISWKKLSRIAFTIFEGLDDDRIVHLANCSKLQVIRQVSLERAQLHRWSKETSAEKPLSLTTSLDDPDALDSLFRTFLSKKKRKRRKKLKKFKKSLAALEHQAEKEARKQEKEKQLRKQRTISIGGSLSLSRTDVNQP